MRLSKPVFWLVTVLWLAAGTWWYGGCSKCSSCATTSPPIAENLSLPGFAVSDTNWNLSTPANLRFGKSAATPVLSAAMAAIVDSLALYTKNHPGKTITVTGHYNAAETNSTAFENLGLARAAALKDLLVSKGVSEKSILTKSQLDEALVFSPADTLVGGISMAFSTVPPAAPAAVKEDLFAPRTVYFNTAKNTMPVDAAFTGYIELAKIYLQNHAGKKLLITGYTDNAGQAEKNLQLSVSRAAFVKSELLKTGIAEDRMQAGGKGQDDPVADNSTAEGKAKNRRVTIQLQ